MDVSGIVDAFKERLLAIERGPDGYPIRPGDPNRGPHRLLDAYLRQVRASGGIWTGIGENLKTTEVILGKPRKVQVRVVHAVMERLAFHVKESFRSARVISIATWTWKIPYAYRYLLVRLLRRVLPFDEGSLTALLEVAAQIVDDGGFRFIPEASLLGHVERYVDANGLTPALRRALRAFGEAHRAPYSWSLKVRRRVEALLGEGSSDLIEPGEAFLLAGDEGIKDPTITRQIKR